MDRIKKNFRKEVLSKKKKETCDKTKQNFEVEKLVVNGDLRFHTST